MAYTYTLADIFVKAESEVTVEQLKLLDAALMLAQDQLLIFSRKKDTHEKIQSIFRDDVELTVIQKLMEAWESSDFSQLPTIEILPSPVLNGAQGAFATSTERIYLSESLLSSSQASINQIQMVVLEEIGHFLDAQINELDTPGDEGAVFAALVSNSELSQHRLADLRLEDDSSTLSLNGEIIPIEMRFEDQVLWSQRVGGSLDGTIKFGEIIGLERNGGAFSEFFGIEESLQSISSPNVSSGKIGLGNLFSGELSARATIAGSQSKGQDISFRAGLDINAGYDAGEFEWKIPLYADTALKVENNELGFDINFDKSGAYFDLVAPSLFLYADSIFEADAALYFNGTAKGNYFGKSTSKNFGSKLDLSFDANRRLIDFDTRKNKQVIDYIFGKKEFEFGGGADLEIDLPALTNFLDIDFELPNLAEIDLERIPTLELEDSYEFRLADEFNLVDFEFDVDSFFQPVLTSLGIPNSLKRGDGFDIFGKRFGYDIDASLFDISAEASLVAGYELSLGVRNLLPSLEVEGKEFTGSEDIFDLLTTAGDTLDFEFIFDPEFFLKTNAYIRPEAQLTIGIGALNQAEVELAGRKFGLSPQTLFKQVYTLEDFGIVPETFYLFGSEDGYTKKLSEIPFGIGSLLPENLRRNSFSISTEYLAESLNIDRGTQNSDYYPGDDTDNQAILLDGADVAQLSFGEDVIDGGDPLYPGGGIKTSYNAPFFNGISSSPSANDLFILDTDIISANPIDSDAALVIQGNEFKLGIGDYTGDFSELDHTTELRNFERVLFSDALQSSEENVDFLFDVVDSPVSQGKRLYFGGQFPTSEYASNAPLPTGNLTGTQGNNLISLPIAYNRGVPIVLGRGDDRLSLWSLNSEITPNFSAVEWRNPYDGDSHLALTEDSTYTDFIDLGAGRNTVNFRDSLTSIPFQEPTSLLPIRYPYSSLITSAAAGNIMTIEAEAITTPGILVDNVSMRIINLGGSTNASLDNALNGSNNNIYSILSSGNNELQFGDSNISEFELTLLLETQGLQSKFSTSRPIEDAFIEVGSSSGKGYAVTGLDTIENLLFDSFDTRVDRLTIASADVAGSSTFREMGSGDSYSLESPSDQYYVIRDFPADEILVRGRLSSQTDAFRGIELDKSITQSTTKNIYLGRSGDLFDEVRLSQDVINASLNGRAMLRENSSTNFNKVDLSIMQSGYDGRFRGFFTSYIHELRFPDAAKNRIVSYFINDDFGFTTPELQEVEIKSFNSAFSDIFSTGGVIAPAQTVFLGDGDDQFTADYLTYEFIYPGGGNNIIVQHINPADNGSLKLASVNPQTGEREFSQSANGQIGDVVVYTEGISSDYVIRKAQQFQVNAAGQRQLKNAVEVTKPDGTKDLLFGIKFIKFETEDVAEISIPQFGDEFKYSPSNQYIDSKDVFGNDISRRLFVSQVVKPDGRSSKGILKDARAVDRIELATTGEIYQPGSVSNSWSYDVPASMEKLTLSELFLLSDFRDADIAEKELYSAEDIEIKLHRIEQSNQGIRFSANIEANGDLSLNFTEGGESGTPNLDTSAPYTIGYDIIEPEGYSHYVELTLTPSPNASLQDLKSRGVVSLSTISSPENALASLSADISELMPDTSFSISSSTEMPLYDMSSLFNKANRAEDGSTNVVLTGTLENDILEGDDTDNQIYGGSGEDVIRGNAGSDYITGQAGPDILMGGDGDDILDEEASGDDGGNILDGGLGDDIILGSAGDDIILGGAGSDYLIPGFGNDIIDGGNGEDTGVASGNQKDYRIRKRSDGAVVSIDNRAESNEGLALYRNVEYLEFGDITLDSAEIQTTVEAEFQNGDRRVSVETDNGKLKLSTTEGGKFLTIDTTALEDLIIDEVLLKDSLEKLAKYRDNEGNQFNQESEVLEFAIDPAKNKEQEVIELTLEKEQDVDSFIKVNPDSGNIFEFNYDSSTETGAELLDTNGNGLVDLVRIHLKDGGRGDADGEINGLIYDPGFLAKVRPKTVLVGGINNDEIQGSDSDDYINAFGPAPSTIPQFDNLRGGKGSDSFLLGGFWGVSYFEEGDGYAVIHDWDAPSDSIDGAYDRIGVSNPEALGGGFYSLNYKSVDGIGQSLQDTEVYFEKATGERDRIAIIKDTTDVDIERDFFFTEDELQDNISLIGSLGNETLVGRSGSDRLNGFGTIASPIPQFDRLRGGMGSDTFILGGSWGVSYFEEGDGYAVIEDWDPTTGAADSEFDRIEVRSADALGGGFYSLNEKAVNGIGSGATDMEVYFTTAAGQRDRIAIIQDSVDVDLTRDFFSV